MKLKDSLTGLNKAVLPHSVSIYACGITPYSASHVGHARTYVVFDLLAKVLRAQGHEVTLARNITDIDDKIINEAAKQGIEWHELSAHFSELNRGLMSQTGLQVPLEPKASDYLANIFQLIEALLGLGLAYVSETGDVRYRVRSFKGRLLMPHKEGSLLSEQGVTRVDGSGKEDLRDFALWKRTGDADVGFKSPWGWGRPGWHIECSAMIGALFGGSVTIHGGGVDLKHPHHDAEIRQSEPVFGKPLADIWMHNGSVLSEGQKMSKSLGNFVTWQEALDQAEALAPGRGGDLLRIAMLQAHWQKPLDWSPTLLHSTFAELQLLTKNLSSEHLESTDATALVQQLDENLNTPAAFVWLRAQMKAGKHATVAASLRFLGVDVKAWADAHKPAPSPVEHSAEINALIKERNEARRQKNWAKADELRKRLAAMGVSLTDAP
ncbi:cysteine--tRNA ligase [Nostoc sp. CHAB 5834]|nr:cysteine--tRNA ligase [Nostoc sp. CHAB 5834]